MPKHKIVHKQDNFLDKTLRSALTKYFDEKSIHDLETHGGSISISFTLNKSSQKKKRNKESQVTEDLLSQLEGVKNSPDKFLAILNELNKIDLLKLSKMLNQPIRSNAKVDEIKNEILRGFRSEEIWKGISGRED